MYYRVGDIWLVEGLPIHPVKAKFAVLVKIGPNQFFLINSANRADYDCIPYRKNGRKFPIRDSYIGCKNIFEAEPEQMKKKCGELDDNELKTVAEKVRTSRFIAPVRQQPIINAIERELMLRQREEKT